MSKNERKKDLNRKRKRELLGYINSGDFHLLREALEVMHPAELCGLLHVFEDKETDELLGALDNSQIISLFKFLYSDRSQRFRLLWRLPHERLAQLISDMSRRSIADIFEGLSKSQIEALLTQLPPEAVRKIEPCLAKQHGMDLLMTDDFMKVKENLSISETLRVFRGLHHSEDRPNKVYVVDAGERLVGTADLHELLLAGDPAENMVHITKEAPLRIMSDADPYIIARTLVYYGLDNAPVTDFDNRLLGVVTARAAYKFLDAEKESWLDSSAGMAGPLVDDDSDTIADFFLRAGLLGIVMVAAFAVSAVLTILLHPKSLFLFLLPLAPLSIAIGRLYTRYSLVVFQKRRLARQMGVIHNCRRLSVGITAGVLFSLMAGGGALLYRFDYKIALLVCITVAVSVVVGILAGGALFIGAGFRKKFRAVILFPAFLSIPDAVILLILYGLYRVLL